MSESLRLTQDEIKKQTAEAIIIKTAIDYPVAEEVFTNESSLNAFLKGFVDDSVSRIASQLKLQPDINNQGIPNKDAELLLSLENLIIIQAQERLNAVRTEHSVNVLFGKKKTSS